MNYQIVHLEAVTERDGEQTHSAYQACGRATLTLEHQPRQKNDLEKNTTPVRYPPVRWLNKPNKQIITLMLDKIAEL